MEGLANSPPNLARLPEPRQARPGGFRRPYWTNSFRMAQSWPHGVVAWQYAVVFAHSGSAQFSYLEDQVLCLGTRRNNIFGSGVDATGLRSLALGDFVTLLARVDVGLRRDCHP